LLLGAPNFCFAADSLNPGDHYTGMVSFLGASAVDMSKDKYVQTPHIAAGMFFCEGKCIREVPYDPNLPNLFVGEEILHSARVWTAGYDIYSPTQVTVYHLYTRADQPHVWDDKKTFDDTDAFNKAKQILGLQDGQSKPIPEHVKDNIDQYGLGNKRTLKEFFDFAGIDPKNKTIYKNFCPKPHKIAPQSGIPKEGFTEDGKAIQGGDEDDVVEGFTGISDAYSHTTTMSSYVNSNVFYFFLFLLLLLIAFLLIKKVNLIENFLRFYKKNLIFHWKNVFK
jgi:hypothetical protein